MKKLSKKKLPKYPLGGKKPVAPKAIQKDPNYSSSDGNDRGGDGTNQSNNGFNTDNQYLAAGTAIAANAGNIANAFNYEGANDDRMRGDAIYQAGKAGITAVNPVIGGIMAIGDMIGEPIRKSVEKTDENGNLVNRSASNVGHIAGVVTNPFKSLTDTLTDRKAKKSQKILAGLTGGISDVFYTKSYNDRIEDRAKEEILANQVVTPETFDKDYRQDAVWQKLNNYQEFANGGKKSYNPSMSNNKEFLKWYNKFTPEGKAGIPYSDSGDYDYLSYFMNGDYKEYKKGHFPDTYKRPNHETFSNESIYSTPEVPGGYWNGEIYNPNGKFQYANGGMMNGPANASIEKQEMVKFPDGSTDQVDVGTHESGNDVDVNIPDGTKIFSDRLKLPGSKKTVAKEAEAFKTDKEEKILSDKKSTGLAKNTAKLISDMKQRKLDELFQAQEALKQSKVLNYAKKLGVNIPQNQFKMGGMKECYSNGGVKLPKYPNGNSTRNFLDPYKPVFNKPIYPGQSYNPYQKSLEPWSVNTSQDTNLISQPLYDSDNAPTESQTKDTDPYDFMRNRNIYEGISNGLMQNAGNFYDLYLSKFGKKYDTEDYGRINPSYLTPKTLSATESLRDADREAAASRYALRANVGGNAGAYLANLAANQTANTLNKAKIRESINNTNTNILNQADLTNTSIRNDAERYNLDLKYRAKVDTSMNKARSEDIARQAVRGIGENLSESYKDYKLGEQDQKKLALINQVFPNYKFNPNNFEFYYRSAKQANKPKKEKE